MTGIDHRKINNNGGRGREVRHSSMGMGEYVHVEKGTAKR